LLLGLTHYYTTLYVAILLAIDASDRCCRAQVQPLATAGYRIVFPVADLAAVSEAVWFT
jgi:hypothetical protein